MMPLGLWVVFGWMLLVAIIAAALFLWGLKSGQFKDIEEAKYRMMEDVDPEPWPEDEDTLEKGDGK
jgi:cbb3-type cytochrome oxidase maturation protein